MTVDPRQFRALIVGVDDYYGGWNLRGAVRDAFAFADWLAGCKVPPTNLWLCLAGKDLELLYSERPRLLGVHKYGATREAIAAALDECLNDAPGDFCLFWGGHGMLDTSHLHYLICADANDTNLKSFRLQDIRAHLRTESVGAGEVSRLQRSLIIVDACSNYAPLLQIEKNLTAHPFPQGGVALMGRRQCMVVSSRPGDFAREDRMQHTGYFSSQLLEHLRHAADLDTLFDFKTVYDSIERTFDDLRLRGKADQVPTYSEWADWSVGSSNVTGDPGVDGLDSGSVSQAIRRSELDRLLLIVDAVPEAIPSEVAREAFSRVLPLEKSPPESLSASAALRQCLRVLASGLNRALIFVFLELCRRSLANACLTNKIREWEANVAQRLQLNLDELHLLARTLPVRAAPPVAPKAALRVVQVVVEPVPGQILGKCEYQLWARVWAGDNGDGVLPERMPSSAQTHDELKQLLAESCLKMLHNIPTGCSVLIEVVLPAELLGDGVANWPFPKGGRVVPLGQDFELALRSFERGYELGYAGPRLLSGKKWKKVDAGLKQRNVAWLPQQRAGAVLSFDSWDEDDVAALCAHSLALFGPSRRLECIQRLLDAGIPLAVWFLDSSSPPANWRMKLRDGFVAQPHADWPGVARKFRRQHKGKSYHLAVLLDDPSRPLPPLPNRTSSALRAPSSGKPP